MNETMEKVVSALFNNVADNYIFIYTPPKVGSTTLVTSLRVSLGKQYSVLHIHDETMLRVLTGISDIRINDILRYLSSVGKRVYVIDVYRTPIERKMSAYFEKLSPYHFNVSEEVLCTYSMKRIVERFNKVFPHLENGDHYFEQYDIGVPPRFDVERGCTVQEVDGRTYIKLRLCDAYKWSSVLSSIFKREIVVIHDYNTEHKGVGELYKRFKREYRLPANYVGLIEECKYLHFYYSEEERRVYLDRWCKQVDVECVAYTASEFAFYMNICLENQHINDVQMEHYIDNGCHCRCCTEKRKELFFKAKSGEKQFEKIIHTQVIRKQSQSSQTKKRIPNQFKIRVTNF